MNKKINNQSGMTLIETIVALGILTLGIISSLSLMVSAITFSRSSEKMIVVVNLAREGIEITRSLRNNDGFASLTTGNKIGVINHMTGNLSLENANNAEILDCSNCVLQIHNERYYHNSPGDDTEFKRMLTISDVTANEEKKIISTVLWTERGSEHVFKLETNLTNW